MRLSFKAAFFSENTEIMGTEVLDFLTSERNKRPVTVIFYILKEKDVCLSLQKFP